MAKKTIQYRLRQELVKATTHIDMLNNSPCTCGSSHILDCQRCSLEKVVEHWKELIKEAKQLNPTNY